ncbi:hypothetical protein B0H34DRAFT_753337 [Crassisporium funariophilum]|nr:hypothetical protein B0H34DRAFT_753337 [Crassisporium funariophilum]
MRKTRVLRVLVLFFRRLDIDNLAIKIRQVLDCISFHGLDLPLFLDAISWGYPECHSDRKIQYARTSLLASEELPGILRRWYKPPRRLIEGKGRRPAGARATLHEFALECVTNSIDREMTASAPHFLSPAKELTEALLLDVDFTKFQIQVQSHAPTLWKVINHASSTSKQTQHANKDPSLTTLSCIAQMQYSRSHHRNRFQKIWAIYLKACGLSARAFDAIHALGLTMSHKWASNAYGILSDRSMQEARKAIREYPWNMSHDNVNIPLRVFSQRIHNQSHFISATAGTVWILPLHAALPVKTNREFNKFRALHSTKVFEYENVLYGSASVDNRIQAQHQYRLLCVVLDSPDFADYVYRGDPIFFPPPPVQQLPSGPENATRQFILGTCELEEASYEGTLKVMAEFFKQLDLSSEVEESRTSTERFIAWIGDQLTVERLRGLWKYRHEDHNAFDRLDYMIPVFGWFHLVMAFANSLHKQYLGTSAGIGGMRHAFDLLKRKGLISQATKGPFWHHLDEAINHISEAHFRAAWLEAANVKSFTELKNKSPIQLKQLSEKVFNDHCSRAAVTILESQPPDRQDQVKKQWTMWNCDVLPYLELRDAIKTGDVGRIEDLLPTLLFRFAGGGNSKYAIEILELLQGLHQEWPKDVKAFVKTWCWLMNRTGKANGYLPFDLGQEENIADIKVNYRSLGPGGTMEYMKKISPAIPTLRKVQRHIEQQFKTVTRGAHHGKPDKERDVALLSMQYTKSRLYNEMPGRQFKTSGDKAADFVTGGAINLEKSNTIEEWFDRRSPERSAEEIWDEVYPNMGGD